MRNHGVRLTAAVKSGQCCPMSANVLCILLIILLAIGGKTLVYSMDAEIKELRLLGESCGMVGQELLDFVQHEREVIQKRLRAERAESLEIKRQEAEIKKHELESIKMQITLENIKKEKKAPEETSTSSSGAKPKARVPKLPHFDDTRDDLDAYLQRFERYAKNQFWDTNEWATNLSALLKGKALDVYSRLDAEDSNDYAKLKDALLRRFHLNEHGFRQKFRSAKPERDESAPQFAVRLDNLITRWVDMAKISKDYDSLKDLCLREQFMNSCPEQLALFLKERKPANVTEMARLAEQYTDAHGSFGLLQTRKSPQLHFSHNRMSEHKPFSRPPTLSASSKPSHQPGNPNANPNTRDRFQRTCFLCGKPGHIARDCQNKPRSVSKVASVIASAITGLLGNEDVPNENDPPSSPTSREPTQDRDPETVAHMMTIPKFASLETCCTQDGYATLKCGHELPVMTAACKNIEHSGMPVSDGLVNNRRCKVLRDSGCSSVVIKRDLVPLEQLTGQEKSCILVDGSIRVAPVARVQLDTPYFVGWTDALCMNSPVYDVILGNIQGVRSPSNPDPNWQFHVGLNKSLFDDKPHDESHPRVDAESHAVVTRAQKLAQGRPLRRLKVPDTIPDVSKAEICKEQLEDPSLARARELAANKDIKRNKFGAQSNFFWQDDLLFREFSSPTFHHGDQCNQLVVPTKFRGYVMKLAHETILGGHQGPRKTADKVLSEFFWPGCQAEITRYCQSCDICQRTIPKGKVGKVPLGDMPVIDTPFQRVAIDIVGPINPKTERGNRFILTLVDYATRYPEAIALPSIETTRVAEAMVDVFSRVGLPTEILTDQGSQFTSELMKEISRLLSIRQLTTTPYHPSCNGLVERFNGTLKLMLRRLCSEKPRDWDRYLAPLLFAYRETPQSSLQFAPFELLYGRSVRGPMTILKELWTGQAVNPEIKSTYQYVVDLRDRIEQTCQLAHEHLQKATNKNKYYYNAKARAKNLNPGDLVLLLLPTDHNKLLLQWKGPFSVLAKLGQVDYRIDLGEGRTKTFHANLLKKYVARTSNQNAISKSDKVQPEGMSILDITCIGIIECEQDHEWHESISETKIDNEDLITLPTLNAKETVEDVGISSELDPEQSKQVKRLLQNHREVMTDAPGRTNLAYHEIKTTSTEPIRSKPYPLPYALRETVNREIDDMLRLGIIERSDSPYASPIVLVKKRDGSNRFCVDFRKLNKITVFDAEPIPSQEEIFARLANDHYFTKFDLSKGYWQIPVEPNARDKTAFLSPSGLYHFRMMPFGLVNAPATFSRMMRSLLKGLGHVDNYIDDILVHTVSWETHMKVLSELLCKLKDANLTAKPSKCVVGMHKVEFLGHIVGQGQLAPQPDKMLKIQNAPVPQTKKQLRSFLGLSGYYRKFIPNYATLAAPLTSKTKSKEPNSIDFDETERQAFDTLKACLDSHPILHLADCNRPFILRTDASDVGIGAVLLQEKNGEVFPVVYASRKLLDRERAYSIMEKECLALVWAINKFQCYLYGKPFVLETDHQPLVYMQKTKVANPRIMRWALSLQPYQFRIEAIKGSDNVGADYLSRM